MKQSLKNLFSPHARVLGIDIIRTTHLRGQAWITLETTAEATDCVSKLQGFKLFDKPLRVQYAKEDNDRVAKKEGTYVPKEVKAAREKKRKERESKVAAKQAAAAAADPAAKKQKTDAVAATAGDPDAPPSKRLFMPNLPLECTVDMLEVLFSPYAGYTRSSMPKPGMGFVEFLEEVEAGKAKVRMRQALPCQS